MRFVVRFILGLVSLCPSVFSQGVGGGTAAVLIRTPTKVVAAVDSRELYHSVINGRKNTTAQCAGKLRQVGKMVAVVAGFSHGTNGYDVLGTLSKYGPDAVTVDDLLARSLPVIAENLRSLIRDLRNSGMDITQFHKRGDAAVQIGIVSVANKIPAITLVEFFLADPPLDNPVTYTVKRCPGDCPSSNYAFLLGEHLQMERAISARSELVKRPSVETSTDLVALEAAAHPDSVGGDVSTAVIRADETPAVKLAACPSVALDGGMEMQKDRSQPALMTASFRSEGEHQEPDPAAMAESSSPAISEGLEIPNGLPAILPGEQNISNLIQDQLSQVINMQCRQKVRRLSTVQDRLRHIDDLELDIELQSGSERYTQIRRKNRSYARMEDLPGSWSSGQIATLLAITREGVLLGSRVSAVGESDRVVTFHVAAPLQKWYLAVDHVKYWMNITGTIRVQNDRVTGIKWEGWGLPSETGIRRVGLSVSFCEADIANKRILLPFSSVYTVEYIDSAIGFTRDVSSFDHYRRLGATSTIKFE